MPAMRKLIVTLILATALPLTAQEPQPTPAPRRSIIDRMFRRPTPAPAPTPTPAPVKVRIARPKPKPKPTPAPTEPTAEKPATPEPPTVETPAEPPKPVKVKPVKAVPAKPEKPDFSNLDEAAKYKAVKELALKEPAVIDLKSKAESTLDEADAKRASLAYNRALFRKIRDIEPSLEAYVEKLEQAVLKRVK